MTARERRLHGAGPGHPLWSRSGPRRTGHPSELGDTLGSASADGERRGAALSQAAQSLRASSLSRPRRRPGAASGGTAPPARPPDPVPRPWRHLQEEAPLPQHLLAAPPRHPKLLLAVQGAQLERLGLPGQRRHPQGLRRLRPHLLGGPLRRLLTPAAGARLQRDSAGGTKAARRPGKLHYPEGPEERRRGLALCAGAAFPPRPETSLPRRPGTAEARPCLLRRRGGPRTDSRRRGGRPGPGWLS